MISENFIKYIIGLVTVVILRLVPHPPNVEPIMTTMMPFSKKWGWLGGMIFGLLAILSYDIVTRTIGLWSLITISTYSLLGIAAGLYFKNRKSTVKNYLIFAIVGTIVYDAITGIGMGVLLFHQTLIQTLVGQIPFTLYHLGGNIFFAITLSPLVYNLVVKNPKLKTSYLKRLLFQVG